MSLLSKVIKDLAEDFRIPEVIACSLFVRLFSSKQTNEKMILENKVNGSNDDGVSE